MGDHRDGTGGAPVARPTGKRVARHASEIVPQEPYVGRRMAPSIAQPTTGPTPVQLPVQLPVQQPPVQLPVEAAPTPAPTPAPAPVVADLPTADATDARV